MADLFAVFDRRCGHVINVSGTRPAAALAVRIANPTYAYALRIRRAADADLAAIVRGVRCETCSLDGRTVTEEASR